MLRISFSSICGLLLIASAIAASDPSAQGRQGAEGAAAAERFWPQWRGPYATGVSKYADPPLEWSETKNVRWKVEIPGRGSASPVVWGDRVFLLSAVPIALTGGAGHAAQGGVQPRNRHRFVVLAIDRRTGKTLWERTACEAVPHEATHQDNGTYASSSAITDGQRVYAWFESQGMYVYGMDGRLLWHARPLRQPPRHRQEQELLGRQGSPRPGHLPADLRQRGAPPGAPER